MTENQTFVSHKNGCTRSMKVRYSISPQHGPNSIKESDSFTSWPEILSHWPKASGPSVLLSPAVSVESYVTVKLKLELFFKRKAEGVFERPVIKYGKPLRIGTVKFLRL